MKDQVKRVVTYKLDIDILNAMEDYADMQGMTRSALIERAVAYYLRMHEDLKEERENDIAYMKKRLKAYQKRLGNKKIE